jgi:hypothetical protein
MQHSKALLTHEHCHIEVSPDHPIQGTTAMYLRPLITSFCLAITKIGAASVLNTTAIEVRTGVGRDYSEPWSLSLITPQFEAGFVKSEGGRIASVPPTPYGLYVTSHVKDKPDH